MATSVKLKKIDQLIGKLFYDGLRATNSTPVKVVSSSVSKRFDNEPKALKNDDENAEEPQPSTSSEVSSVLTFDNLILVP